MILVLILYKIHTLFFVVIFYTDTLSTTEILLLKVFINTDTDLWKYHRFCSHILPSSRLTACLMVDNTEL